MEIFVPFSFSKSVCNPIQVKHMGLEHRVKLARLMVALAEDDRDAVVAAYTDMGVRTKRMGKYRKSVLESGCNRTAHGYLGFRRGRDEVCGGLGRGGG